MTSVNSKNIFDVVKKKYAPNQPEKNHKIDPVYSLFDRDDPLPKCQELAFFTDTSMYRLQSVRSCLQAMEPAGIRSLPLVRR